MISVKGTKINKALKAWPHGTVATASWFEEFGIGHQLRSAYQQSAWIKRLSPGAFIREEDNVSWEGGLYAIQKHLHLPIHVAAKTALEFQGVAHFIPTVEGRSITLFATPRTKLPFWFKKHDWHVNLHFITANLFSGTKDVGLIEKSHENYSLCISSRERAILELLHLVPQSQSFEEAKLLFESLRTLRPEFVQILLQNCLSIKAKRLFLYFADSTNQPWLDDLDLSKINLGKGKRVIAGGGVFNNKYDISVPKIFGEEKQELEGA